MQCEHFIMVYGWSNFCGGATMGSRGMLWYVEEFIVYYSYMGV